MRRRQSPPLDCRLRLVRARAGGLIYAKRKSALRQNVIWKYPQFTDSDWQGMAERRQTKLALQHFLQWLTAQREVVELRKSNMVQRRYE